MNQIGYLPYIDFEQRSRERLKEAEQDRLFTQAVEVERAKEGRLAKFMSVLAKELRSVGFSVEMRFSDPVEAGAVMSQQVKPENCA